MIEAKIIADSVNEYSKRLVTYKLRYPRFIHAEFMTHRVISRNASSSRAVPVAKLLEEVRSDSLRAAPVFWGAEQKGMQTGAELTGDDLFNVQWDWHMAALYAADMAERMVDAGLHKSIANRILEPFSHINVVASATDWGNFFGLRLHKDAEPTMRALAQAMWRARAESKPRRLKPGEWHLPFVDEDEIANKDWSDDPIAYQIKVSVARCARVSYESFETGKLSTIEEDLRLYERLVGAEPLHASPTEHQATPDIAEYMGWNNPEQHGNFTGWLQFRKILDNEAVAPLPEEYR